MAHCQPHISSNGGSGVFHLGPEVPAVRATKSGKPGKYDLKPPRLPSASRWSPA
jgi:hypothetical protein